MSETENENSVNKFEFTIRAAAFYRIIGNAQTVVLNEGKNGTFLEQLFKEISQTPSPALEALCAMVMEMNTNGALAVFPVSDVVILAEMIRRIIVFYKSNPEFATKIALMCGIAILGDGYGYPLVSAPRSARLREIAQLNNNFHNISKLMKDSSVMCAEFTTMETVFHPESQFLSVVVNI